MLEAVYSRKVLLIRTNVQDTPAHLLLHAANSLITPAITTDHYVVALHWAPITRMLSGAWGANMTTAIYAG